MFGRKQPEPNPMNGVQAYEGDMAYWYVVLPRWSASLNEVVPIQIRANGNNVIDVRLLSHRSDALSPAEFWLFTQEIPRVFVNDRIPFGGQ